MDLKPEPRSDLKTNLKAKKEVELESADPKEIELEISADPKEIEMEITDRHLWFATLNLH